MNVKIYVPIETVYNIAIDHMKYPKDLVISLVQNINTPILSVPKGQVRDLNLRAIL